MNLLELKQREQNVMDHLRQLSADAEDEFQTIAGAIGCIEDDKNTIEEAKHAIARIQGTTKKCFDELNRLKYMINLELEAGKEQILTDIKSGKVGLVELATGRPMTVALFAQR